MATLVVSPNEVAFREFVKTAPQKMYHHATPRSVRGLRDCDVIFLPGWRDRKDIKELVENIVPCLSDKGALNGFFQLLREAAE